MATDILFLDKIAPNKLCEISKNLSMNNGHTTTIYHFGYNENAKKFIGFTYREVHSFKSEELIYSTGILTISDIIPTRKAPEPTAGLLCFRF